MRLATWNVNSLRARLEIVLEEDRKYKATFSPHRGHRPPPPAAAACAQRWRLPQQAAAACCSGAWLDVARRSAVWTSR